MATKKFYYAVRLEDKNGEYSANPDDYFMMPEDKPFKGNLVGTVYRAGGWSRREIIKKNPTRKDMRKYYRMG